jgi:hypothetical protein
LEFTADKQGASAVILQWKTASETENSYFDVERSVDGLDFVKLGDVPGNGTTHELNDYSFTDWDLDFPGQKVDAIYYRLRQVDFNGDHQFSPIRKVVLDKYEVNHAQGLTAYPNPFSSKIQIDLNPKFWSIEERIKVSMYNLEGKKVQEQVIELANDDQLKLKLFTSTLPMGSYTVDVHGQYTGQSERINIVHLGKN